MTLKLCYFYSVVAACPGTTPQIYWEVCLFRQKKRTYVQKTFKFIKIGTETNVLLTQVYENVPALWAENMILKG